MCVGLASQERLIRSAAAGPGNVVVLMGAATGRDGIGGGSGLASAELGEGDAAKRPSVQIGDPFAESELLECCLDLLDRELLVSLQDLGAAGLTSSASEMAEKGGVGIDLDVALVPLREEGMAPWEVMISESQERMLCVVTPEQLDAVLAVCEHWQVRATPIGEVTDSGRFRVLDAGPVVADLPVEVLVDCPLYDLDPVAPTAPLYPAPPRVLESVDPGEALDALLRSPNLASRMPVFEQYDPLVQSRTVRRPAQADAAVLVLDPATGDGPAIAVSIDGNGRRVACSPEHGAPGAVYDCATTLAAVGAEPLGLTNCLSFGNPEKPHVAWQLERAIAGLSDALTALGVPVVGGNVSLYNESGGGPIYPTPVVGMVGAVPPEARVPGLGFVEQDHLVALIAPRYCSISLPGSELAKLHGEPLPDGLPGIDVAAVQECIDLVCQAARRGDIASAHDVAEGGVAVALAECCLAGGRGATVVLPDVDTAPLTHLFGEGVGRFVVSGVPAAIAGLGELATPIATVGGDALELNGVG